MPVVKTLKKVTPTIYIPPTYSPCYKVTITQSDGTVLDMTSRIVYMEIENGVTDTIGRFEMQIYDPDNDYMGIWTGRETFKFYCDYAATATTLRFRGKSEKVTYSDDKLKMTGRSDAVDYINITVTKQYSAQSCDTILKSLVSSYSTGFTTSGVEACSTNLTVNWVQKPFWDAVKELCKAANFDAYISEAKDWNFFAVNSRKSSTEAIIHDSNLMNVGDFALDNSLIKNRIVVYGAQQKGVQIISTAQDTTSQTLYGIKEEIVKDDNITNQTQADELSASKLAELKDPPRIGDVTGFMLATLAPGEMLRVSSPNNGVPNNIYPVLSYIHKFDITGDGLTTTVRINKEPTKITHIFKDILEKQNKTQNNSINPFEMRDTFNFLFDVDEGSHSNTVIANGILKLSLAGSGYWESPSKSLSSTLDKAYLIVTGSKLSGAVFYVSGDNGLNYEAITNQDNSALTLSTARGTTLRVKVMINDDATEIYSLSLQYVKV